MQEEKLPPKNVIYEPDQKCESKDNQDETSDDV